MSRLQCFSEPYQATGSLAAIGVLNQLGRPDTEPLEVLVREAVQNCWDAGREDVETVEVEIGGRTLDAAALAVLRERILPDPPEQLPLGECLGGDVQLLHFADFGTRGLGGPTRADIAAPGVTDFIDFVRNIGQPPDKELGAGSFGYGKAAFYIASRARTIIVDTYCQPEGERRLIAYGLGEQFRAGGRPYTGRHWWGVVRDDVPEPLLGEAAAELAAELGLPERGPGDYGTTVAIVAPRLWTTAGEEDLDLGAAMEFISECLLWNFWPKLIHVPGEAPAMSFRLSVEGEESPLPDPRAHPQLAPFTEAMDLLRDPAGAAPGDPFCIRKDLECRNPKKVVGTLALRKTVTTPAPGTEGPCTGGAQETAAGLHHVALMRNAELVVRYRPGPVLPVPKWGYAGVFRCTEELDDVFRDSEPPTHDAWNSKTLSDPRERKYVNASSNRMEEVLRGLAGPSSAGTPEGAGIPVGRFADQLAGLMVGIDGPGARRSPSPRPGGGGSGGGSGAGDGAGAGGTGGGGAGVAGPQIVQINAPELRVDGGGTAIMTPFMLDTDGVRAWLRARVEVLTMDGGQVESEPPIGAASPAVVRWITPGGETRSGEEALADPAADGRWEVWVEHHPDLMVRVAIDAEAVES
jgi:hypothetical protein